MNRWRGLIILAVAAVATATAITWDSPLAEQGQRPGRGWAPVKVINGPGEPLPVEGTTSISGTPDVNVVNTPLGVQVANTPLPTVAQGTTTVAGTVQAQQSGSWSVGLSGTADVNVVNTPGVTVANTPNVNVSNIPNVIVGNDAANPVIVSSVSQAASSLPALTQTIGGPGTFAATASTAFHDIYTTWTPMTLCMTVDNFGSGGVQFFFKVGSAGRAHYVPAGKMEVGCSDQVDGIEFQCASGCEFDWRIDKP